LLSAISGHFTKALILGALFPAAVFVLLWLLFVAPLLPPAFALAAPRVLGTDWNALSVTFATLLLTGILYNLDTPLIQLYEGYPWQNSLLGKWRTRIQRARLDRIRRQVAVLSELCMDDTTAEYDRLLSARSQLRSELLLSFPDSDDSVLPTRLGNILRAFERYPYIQYRIEAIAFWPRLIAVIPPPYAEAIGDARTSLVFLLNLSFLTALLGITTVLAGLVYLPPGPLTHVVLPALGFAVASVWLYGRSFAAAGTWGELVKGAFDLYRWELLTKLGYQQKPSTREEERALWDRIGWQVVFGDEQVGLSDTRPRVDYTDPQRRASVSAEPDGIQLELSRGVERLAWRRKLRVVVSVANTDPEQRKATGVVVTDALPKGMGYVWASARVDGRAVRVVGTDPYSFHLGNVKSGASVVLTYTAIPTDSKRGG
jgi:uncharacterized repeat protein (TIGR01451 family)